VRRSTGWAALAPTANGGGFDIDADKKPNNEKTLLVLPVTFFFIFVDRSHWDSPLHVRNPEIVTTQKGGTTFSILRVIEYIILTKEIINNKIRNARLRL
jgi:hypothetical protein